MASSVARCLLVAFVGLVFLPSSARAQAPDLGTAGDFSVLAGQTVTNTGPSVLTTDAGVSPGTAITGFPPGIVLGAVHAGDGVASGAQSDLTTAYNDAAGRPSCLSVPSNLGGLTLVPGVYCGDTLSITGTLTLDAQGDAGAVWIFQGASTLITASGSVVSVINGGQDCNVFWQVGSSATLGTGSAFVGNILALTSITATTGASVSGRLLARNGSVTLDTNVITASECAVICTDISLSPLTLPVGTVGVPYSQQITASGGTGPYAFNVQTGTPPAGLSLSGGGLVAGTPTTEQLANFTVRATDSLSCAGEATYALAVQEVAPVPTMSQWMMFGLAGLLGLAGAAALRRRPVPTSR
jgi:hypothetical protein